MKVRHVISTSGRLPHNPLDEPVSGVVVAALDLARPQARAGRMIEIWGWNDTHRSQETRWNELNIWTSPEWSWARFAQWDLSWLAPVWCHSITKMPVDVLHAHVDPNLLYLPGAGIRLLHLHTPVLDPMPPSYQRLLRRADAVICCSNFLRSRFLCSSGFPAEQTFVIHNGVDLKVFDQANGSELRAQWGCNENDFVILYSGAIVPEKGLSHLIQAFTQIQSKLPNAVLIIVGGAKLWSMPGGNVVGDTYEVKVRQLAHNLNIRFLGSLPRNELPAAYAAADVVVVPSVWDDPHPVVICEAMGAGRPVVASRVGGITETVQDGQAGILVPAGDDAQLAEAIVTLGTQPFLRERMGRAAYEQAKLFTWEASAQRLDDIYLTLLERTNGHKTPAHKHE